MMPDPDHGRIERGHVCKHGIQWPHACAPCDVAAFASRHTPAQLEFARQCAAQYWQTGEASDEAAARSILSGEWDDQAYTQAALAAVVATAEKAAVLLELRHGWPRDGDPGFADIQSIRAGDYLL